MKSKRTLLLTVAAAPLALFYPVLGWAQQSEHPAWYGPGPWHMWGGGWGFWWIFPLCMFLFMIFILAAVFFLGHRACGGGYPRWGPWHMMDRPSGPGRSWGDPTYSAVQILNERFAKGEIQKQEYEEKKAAILSGVHR